ncbi:MAG: hypothetical protein H0X25_17100 [Acidobacteriales bacterium]|nr:hypothetical protein [Terriglobales bacterium]
MILPTSDEKAAIHGSSQTLSYTWRPSLKASLQTCTLTPEGITAQNGVLLPLETIASLRLYSVPGLRSMLGTLAQSQRICIITSTHGQKIQLGSLHFLGLGRFEDRSKAFDPFVASLVSQAREVNPMLPVWLGMPGITWCSWMLTFGSLTTALTLVTLLGVYGLTLRHNIGWTTGSVLALMFAVALMLGNFVRVTWQCRSRLASD